MDRILTLEAVDIVRGNLLKASEQELSETGRPGSQEVFDGLNPLVAWLDLDKLKESGPELATLLDIAQNRDSLLINNLLTLAFLNCVLESILKPILDIAFLVLLATLDCRQDASLLDCLLVVALLDCHCHLEIIISRLILGMGSLVLLSSLDGIPDSLLIDCLLLLALLDCRSDLIGIKPFWDLALINRFLDLV
ncbi:hypothetical protein PG991_011843 [Apiospora marii]|uniref:Uncharacterized protein n=1 Tax=Apiospora marii TaxID=335849 RepID=A0ABR1RFA4_9PEZI